MHLIYRKIHDWAHDPLFYSVWVTRNTLLDKEKPNQETWMVFYKICPNIKSYILDAQIKLIF